MMMLHKNFFAILFLSPLLVQPAFAGLTIAPYVSIKSTKSVKPQKDRSTEKETIKQRQEYGVTAAVGYWRIFKSSLSLGQSVLTTTEKVQTAKDEYDEIDYKKDLNMSTNNPDLDMKLTETQTVGKFSMILDPSFSVFILRAKIGVTAMLREIEKEATGMEPEKITKGPTYKPHSGVGAGIKFGPRMYFMVEYAAFHYKFPDVEPFERELAVSYGISF